MRKMPNELKQGIDTTNPISAVLVRVIATTILHDIVSDVSIERCRVVVFVLVRISGIRHGRIRRCWRRRRHMSNVACFADVAHNPTGGIKRKKCLTNKSAHRMLKD